MLPGSGVNLQGLLLRPGGFHSRGVSPDDSLVEGLRVEAHADAPGHAAGSAVLPGSWMYAQQRAPSSICLLMHHRAFPEWKRYRGATSRATQHGLSLCWICMGS